MFVLNELYYAGQVTVCEVQVKRGEQRLAMVLKFRRVDASADDESVTPIQLELQNYLSHASLPGLAEVFPKLFFAVNVLNVLATKSRWEAIAMEPLVSIDVNSIQIMELYQRFAAILTRLHTLGYAHGDPHRQSFMKKMRQGSEDEYTLKLLNLKRLRQFPVSPWDYQVYENLDPRKLPADDPMSQGEPYCQHLTAKVMIIHDFNRLFYVNNPYLTIMQDTAQKLQVDALLAAIYDKKAAMNMNSFLFCPWHYSKDWAAETKWDPIGVYNVVSSSVQFHKHLDASTIHTILCYYKTAFEKNNLLSMNAKLLQAYQEFSATGQVTMVWG